MKKSLFKFNYNVWQVGALKFAMLCFGIAIGAYWSTVFLPYLSLLVAAGALLGIYLLMVWLKG